MYIFHLFSKDVHCFYFGMLSPFHRCQLVLTKMVFGQLQNVLCRYASVVYKYPSHTTQLTTEQVYIESNELHSYTKQGGESEGKEERKEEWGGRKE